MRKTIWVNGIGQGENLVRVHSALYFAGYRLIGSICPEIPFKMVIKDDNMLHKSRDYRFRDDIVVVVHGHIIRRQGFQPPDALFRNFLRIVLVQPFLVVMLAINDETLPSSSFTD